MVLLFIQRDIKRYLLYIVFYSGDVREFKKMLFLTSMYFLYATFFTCSDIIPIHYIYLYLAHTLIFMFVSNIKNLPPPPPPSPPPSPPPPPPPPPLSPLVLHYRFSFFFCSYHLSFSLFLFFFNGFSLFLFVPYYYYYYYYYFSAYLFVLPYCFSFFISHCSPVMLWVNSRTD